MKLREALSRFQEQVMHRGPTQAERAVFRAALEAVKPITDDDCQRAAAFTGWDETDPELTAVRRGLEAFMDGRWPDRNETE